MSLQDFFNKAHLDHAKKELILKIFNSDDCLDSKYHDWIESKPPETFFDFFHSLAFLKNANSSVDLNSIFESLKCHEDLDGRLCDSLLRLLATVRSRFAGKKSLLEFLDRARVFAATPLQLRYDILSEFQIKYAAGFPGFNLEDFFKALFDADCSVDKLGHLRDHLESSDEVNKILGSTTLPSSARSTRSSSFLDEPPVRKNTNGDRDESKVPPVCKNTEVHGVTALFGEPPSAAIPIRRPTDPNRADGGSGSIATYYFSPQKN